MTDYQKTKALFDELGIGYEEKMLHENLIIELVHTSPDVAEHAGFVASYWFDLEETYLYVFTGENE